MDSSGGWRAIAETPALGSHILMWGDATQTTEDVLEAFLRGSLARDDLLAVTLPREELLSLRARMATRGLDLGDLERAGRAVIVGSEDAYRDGDPVAATSRVLLQFKEMAAERGKRQVSLLGKIAPVAFGRGETAVAHEIERVAQREGGDFRILCLYDANSLTPDRIVSAAGLVRLHTHTITPAEGETHAEKVANPQERPGTAGL